MVSDQGRVYSLPRRRVPWGRLRRSTVGTRGYPVVSLTGNRVRPVHWLVAFAFLGPRPDGLEVRHLNGDKLDARLVNLAYGTHADNNRDTVAHGNHNHARKTHCIYGHPFNEGNTYESRAAPTRGTA